MKKQRKNFQSVIFSNDRLKLAVDLFIEHQPLFYKKKRIFSIINDYKLNEIAKHFKDEKMIEKEENDQLSGGGLVFLFFFGAL